MLITMNGDAIKELEAIRKTQAVIEFTPDGIITDVNDIFLNVVGYARAEVVNQHHSLFIDRDYAQSPEYKKFWETLALGEPFKDQFLRYGKGGKQVWLQAIYTPIAGRNGQIKKVVKYATDITDFKNASANAEGQMAAINRVQAVIEFDMQGNILHANENFLKASGYTLSEIRGKHHRVFVDPTEAASADYRAFWENLAKGEYQVGQYHRFGKGGRSVWMQASYNPIFNASGQLVKVVKYATDITENKHAEFALAKAVEEGGVVIAAARQHDLTARVALEGKSGSIAALSAGINELLDVMVSIVNSMSSISSKVHGQSETILEDSRQLAVRSEEQSTHLEEAAATSEELAASVKEMMHRAQEATNLGAKSTAIAHRGGEIVKQAVEAMERIKAASKSISEITSVIDSLAFQTNLLALNAAVEAARAGESGRGFAVVASEVRALAQRSADAAKSISGLIANSTAEIDHGVGRVTETGAVLNEMVTSSNQVAAALVDISSASVEQATGIEELARVVSNMDESNQQNASMASQNASILNELKDLTAQMETTLERYKIQQNATHRLAASRMAA